MTESASELIDDRFRILERIGAGGMSKVYRAVDLSSGATVALKVMAPEFLAVLPEERDRSERRFQREARILEALRGVDQVVRFIAARLDAQPPWIAMELVEGISLREMIERSGGRMASDLMVAIAREVVTGLRNIHRQRVLHRDLAPENIIVSRGKGGAPRVVFLDFGIGKSLEPEQSPVTRQTTLMGKPSYVAPEQSRGQLLTAGFDVYALGVVLYEMITGHLPLEIRSFAEIARLRREAPRPLAAFPSAARVPEELRALVMSCLAKEPEDRPTTDELLECLVELERRHADG
ncbi:MAG: serine/threonine protein kinase, partial [Planctomycetes bacterium]|nr:serine/threonine protein kinase [Planctomycetota bacterium]